LFETTIGRLLFNSALPKDYPYINSEVRKKELSKLVDDVIKVYGLKETPKILDKIKQSVIFIPHLTPVSFEWRLFNVRYGVMMVPVVAVFIGYLFSRIGWQKQALVIALCFLQLFLFQSGYSSVISYADGVEGLSHAKRPDAEVWMKEHYDGGLVLMDDYARTISIIRSGIPMQSVIYIGNKPYWEESLKEPEKYATWVVLQKSDAVWNQLYQNDERQKRLYTYFEKAYTSPDIMIFKRQRGL
jgi:hypothetical protein